MMGKMANEADLIESKRGQAVFHKWAIPEISTAARLKEIPSSTENGVAKPTPYL
jgi:hypothetical protein